jgi:hypothetical protein
MQRTEFVALAAVVLASAPQWVDGDDVRVEKAAALANKLADTVLPPPSETPDHGWSRDDLERRVAALEESRGELLAKVEELTVRINALQPPVGKPPKGAPSLPASGPPNT